MFRSEAVEREIANFEDYYASHRILKSQHAPSVFIVSADSALRDDVVDLLLGIPFTLVLASDPDELKIVRETENVVACLCGFELSDGRFRDVMSHMKEFTVEVPVIQVSSAGNPWGQTDFLDGLIAGAFDFICRPFQRSEVLKIVWSAVQAFDELARNKWARRYISGTSQIRFGPCAS